MWLVKESHSYCKDDRLGIVSDCVWLSQWYPFHMDTQPSRTRFPFTQQQLSLVGKHVLCKFSRWRWKSGCLVFSLFSLWCGCVGSAQYVFIHTWWRIWQRVHAFLDLLQYKPSSENFSLVPVAPYVYCRPAAKDCLDEAKGPIILATRCHKLERHGIETKFSC